MFRDRTDKVIGFTASCFDVGPHAGHLAMLEFAKRHCDYLIVALHVDPSSERASKNKPIPNVSQRYLSLASCGYVDEIVPYESEEELVDLLKLVRPHKRFLGMDYKGKASFTGSNISSIEIVFCPRDHSVSSSGIRKNIFDAELAKQKCDKIEQA